MNNSTRTLLAAAVGLGLLAPAACVTTPPPPEIVQVHRTAPPSANPLVGVNLSATRPVENVRLSVAGKTYPRSPSGATYLRLAPGSHTITVSYDIYQADGTLGSRTTRQRINVPNTMNPVTTTIVLR